jgi:hypothetical protein
VIFSSSSDFCFLKIGECVCSLGVQRTFRRRFARSCSVDKVLAKLCMERWRKKNGLHPVVGRLEYGVLFVRNVGSIY